MPAVRKQLTPKFFVDQVISYHVHETSFLRLNPNEENNLDEQDSISLNFSAISPKTTIELPTKNYVDSLHEINRNRRDISSVFNAQDNEFDVNKLFNLDSVVVNRNPSSGNELANKRYIDDSIGEGSIARFRKSHQN